MSQDKPVLSREQIEAFRRIAKVEFQGTRVDQICDLALRAIDRQEECVAKLKQGEGT
jgi:hypothetical protein